MCCSNVVRWRRTWSAIWLATIIEVPVKNAVATYYEDVTVLFELGLADKVVAIPDPVFIAEGSRRPHQLWRG